MITSNKHDRKRLNATQTGSMISISNLKPLLQANSLSLFRYAASWTRPGLPCPVKLACTTCVLERRGPAEEYVHGRRAALETRVSGWASRMPDLFELATYLTVLERWMARHGHWNLANFQKLDTFGPHLDQFPLQIPDQCQRIPAPLQRSTVALHLPR